MIKLGFKDFDDVFEGLNANEWLTVVCFDNEECGNWRYSEVNENRKSNPNYPYTAYNGVLTKTLMTKLIVNVANKHKVLLISPCCEDKDVYMKDLVKHGLKKEDNITIVAPDFNGIVNGEDKHIWNYSVINDFYDKYYEEKGIEIVIVDSDLGFKRNLTSLDESSLHKVLESLRRNIKKLNVPIIVRVDPPECNQGYFGDINDYDDYAIDETRDNTDFLLVIKDIYIDVEDSIKKAAAIEVNFFDFRIRKLETYFYIDIDGEEMVEDDRESFKSRKEAKALGLREDEAIVYAMHWNEKINLLDDDTNEINFDLIDKKGSSNALYKQNNN